METIYYDPQQVLDTFKHGAISLAILAENSILHSNTDEVHPGYTLSLS